MTQKRSLGFNIIVIGSALLLTPSLWAVDPTTPSEKDALVRAALRTDHPIIQAGQPVWVEFSLTNLTAEPLTLRVPEVALNEAGNGDMGLPIEHVFSGVDFSALFIENVHGEVYDTQVSHRPKEEVPVVHIAPFGSIGLRVDLTQYYESLRRPDQYTLIWRPYRGTVESEPLTIKILAEKEAVIFTSCGAMTMRFYYNAAPNHVWNFIELIESHFYENLTFHRIIAGGLIQGGCPKGNGYGVRKDGKRLKAEFSDTPFKRGTVGMARSPGDPDSASCQFFICLSRQASFDRTQTAFGYLVGEESFETLEKIAATPTGYRDRPKEPVYIRAISLENIPLKEHEAPGRSDMNEPTTRPAIIEGSGAEASLPPSERKDSARGGLSALRKATTRSRPAE